MKTFTVQLTEQELNTIKGFCEHELEYLDRHCSESEEQIEEEEKFYNDLLEKVDIIEEN